MYIRDGHLVVQSQGHLPHDVMAELQANRDRLVEIMTLDKTPVAAVQGDPGWDQETRFWIELCYQNPAIGLDVNSPEKPLRACCGWRVAPPECRARARR